MVIPLGELPAALRDLAQALPAAALTEAVTGALRDPVDVPGRAWLVLVAWALVAPAVAAWRFRWE
jgi:hypothetical protein